MSKKKIVLCIIAALCIIAVIIGISAKRAANKNKPTENRVESIVSTDLAQNKELKLIAHRGLNAIAPENTVPAFERAGEAGYWGAECDIFRTADGKWVLHHDADTKRMTNGNLKIEKSKYEELQKLTVDNGNGLDTYSDVKIATLDEYLDVCKSLGMNPVIELKSENNTEYYNEITEAVKTRKLNAVYISFYKDDLKAVKKLDDKAQLFLLVDKIDSDAVNFAKELGNCGIDFNAGNKKNLKNKGAAIKKITDAKIPAAAWTVDDIETMQTLVDCGVLYITTDCITY
ncbi:MAG: hypothetical protein II744_08545 [Eubacterium sp.]|nr:hypothetical protein [Eubacterium sp.]